MRSRRVVGAALIAAFLAAPAAASFHLMQIEQAIGGVCGDTSQQAVQLRLRAGSQNFVSGAQLLVRDATGNNPITLITFPGNVTFGTAGRRILSTTTTLASAQGITADFTLAVPIPASYLAAGRLTFEDGFNTVYWSLAWGGASYTGAHDGSTFNDADGNYGPAFAGGLPYATSSTLLFDGAAGDLSTNNAADYVLSSSPATLTNNAGTGFVLIDCVFGDAFEVGNLAAWSSSVP